MRANQQLVEMSVRVTKLVLGWGQEEVSLVPTLFLAHTDCIKEEMSLEAWGKWAIFLMIGTVSPGVVDYLGTRSSLVCYHGQHIIAIT